MKSWSPKAWILASVWPSFGTFQRSSGRRKGCGAHLKKRSSQGRLEGTLGWEVAHCKSRAERPKHADEPPPLKNRLLIYDEPTPLNLRGQTTHATGPDEGMRRPPPLGESIRHGGARTRPKQDAKPSSYPLPVVSLPSTIGQRRAGSLHPPSPARLPPSPLAPPPRSSRMVTLRLAYCCAGLPLGSTKVTRPSNQTRAQPKPVIADNPPG